MLLSGADTFVSLLQTLLALAAVCILAWVVLRWGARRGWGFGQGRIKVLERVPLDARRSLFLVQLGDRVLLIGAGEGASPSVLAELSEAELPPLPERAGLFGMLARKPPEPPPRAPEPPPPAPPPATE